MGRRIFTESAPSGLTNLVILSENIFKTPSLPKHKNLGPEIVRQGAICHLVSTLICKRKKKMLEPVVEVLASTGLPRLVFVI